MAGSLINLQNTFINTNGSLGSRVRNLGDNIAQWGHLPDYIEGSAWDMTVIDNLANNSIISNAYITDWSSYIEDITIPNKEIEINKSDFDTLTEINKKEYGDITITFYDNILGTCYKFFYLWLCTIYDFQKNCLKNSWRKEGKKLMLYYYRINNVGGIPVPTKPLNFVCEGCYPTSLSDISFSQEGSGRSTFTANLTCKKTYLSDDFSSPLDIGGKLNDTINNIAKSISPLNLL